jgi:hypothetical protein
MIDDVNNSEDFVWGIHAKYVVSALYVFWTHVAILATALSFWVWWQRERPDDIQGAAVLVTVAGMGISIFWSSTGILNGLR